MEGANLTGDQKEPHKSIPSGTLWAVFTSVCTYLLLIMCFAGSLKRKTLINDLNVFQNSSLETPSVTFFSFPIDLQRGV
jgi:potassium/chloride transporter 9